LDLEPNFGTNFFPRNHFFESPIRNIRGLKTEHFSFLNPEFSGFRGTSAKLSFGAIVSNLQTLKNRDIWTFGLILTIFFSKNLPKNPPISSSGPLEAFWDLFDLLEPPGTSGDLWGPDWAFLGPFGVGRSPMGQS
jgi:hypothetical protein